MHMYFLFAVLFSFVYAEDDDEVFSLSATKSFFELINLSEVEFKKIERTFAIHLTEEAVADEKTIAYKEKNYRIVKTAKYNDFIFFEPVKNGATVSVKIMPTIDLTKEDVKDRKVYRLFFASFADGDVPVLVAGPHIRFGVELPYFFQLNEKKKEKAKK